MDNVFLGVLITIFTAVILFMMLNTVIFNDIIPVFDSLNTSLNFVDHDEYSEKSTFFGNVFLTAMFIVIAIPFIWVLVRILKREPEPIEFIGG